MFKKILISTILISIPITFVLGFLFWKSQLPLVSPLSLIEVYVNPHKNYAEKIVYGFLPYWNLKYKDKLRITELTHFAYFAVDLDTDGTILKKINKKELEPGWNKLNSNDTTNLLYQLRLLNKKTIITITSMDTDSIESILDNPQNLQNAIESSLSVYQDYKFQGINIDFEYAGNPSEKTRQNFVFFIKSLKERCSVINPKCEIDIDIFADSADKIRLYDLKALNPYVDKVIVMAYDYYRKSSSQAGPVAPLRGSCETVTNNQKCLDWDISTHLSQITQQIPTKKIILGVPFYGYEWQTTSTDFLANTYPKTGSLATYQRVNSLFNDDKISSLSASWSAITLSPFLSYYEDSKIYQVHFENPQSIELKIKLIKSLGLGGVGIWVLGYEVPYLDIWQPISDWVNN